MGLNDVSNEFFFLKVDPKTRKVHVGKWVSQSLYLGLRGGLSENNIWLKEEILRENDIEISSNYDNKLGLKNVHKEIASYLGSKFYHRLFSAIWTVNVKPIIDYCDRYCFYSNGKDHYYKEIQIARLWKHKKIIDAADDDGLDNIIPLLIYFGLSPHSLKNKLGKGLWSRLCHNSRHKNKLLVAVLQKLLLDNKRVGCFKFTKYRYLIIEKVSVFQSSLLKYLGVYEYFIERMPSIKNKENIHNLLSIFEWLSCNVRVSKYQECVRYFNILKDTKRMVELTGRKFNNKWSVKRLEREHLINLRILQSRDFPDVPYPHLNDIDDGNIDGVRYKLLRSPYQLWEEGNIMHHCVASYHYRVKEGNYLVFNLTDFEKKRSTLGLYKNDKNVVVDQHYMNWNEEVKSPLLIKAAGEIVSMVESLNFKN